MRTIKEVAFGAILLYAIYGLILLAKDLAVATITTANEKISQK